MVPVLKPSLSENVSVYESGDDERKSQMGTEQNGVIGGRNVDQIAFGHDRQIFQGSSPQVRKGHESSDVETNECDDRSWDTTTNESRIRQRMYNGHVTIKSHTDE